MQLCILGSGHATATKCYNTCFALREKEEILLVDGGGGNGLLRQLERARIPYDRIHQIFVTHRHMDHILGVAWMIRMVSQKLRLGRYPGELFIYAGRDVLEILSGMAKSLMLPAQYDFIGKRIHLIEAGDGLVLPLLGHRMEIFDIGSTKTPQLGFSLFFDGKKLTCLGDEPCHEKGEPYAFQSDWLLHEAFCLFSEAEKFAPYEKHHGTVRDACQSAQRLKVRNLILYHTEDSHLPERKALYGAEGRAYFNGNLYIPDDLETFSL